MQAVGLQHVAAGPETGKNPATQAPSSANQGAGNPMQTKNPNEVFLLHWGRRVGLGTHVCALVRRDGYCAGQLQTVAKVSAPPEVYLMTL